ncbi:hypothetical protein ACFP6B_06910, partial [Rothia nasimurium]|uniref:hypothetical protein n=1 Tax=Rothia nasimurium TaxID=85336 RepID=UPI00361ACCA4
MSNTTRSKDTLWKHLVPLNIFGLALGLFIYFLRLQFNIDLLVRNSTEDIEAYSKVPPAAKNTNPRTTANTRPYNP